MPQGTPSLTRAERDTVTAAAARVAEVTAGRDRARLAAVAERARLQAQRDYFGTGAAKTAKEQALLAARAARLDSLEGTLEALLARLEHVRDEATRRVLERGARVLAAARGNRLWIASLRRLHVDGPERARTVAPRGMPDPDSLTRAESAGQAIEAPPRAWSPTLPAGSPVPTTRSGTRTSSTARGAWAGRRAVLAPAPPRSPRRGAERERLAQSEALDSLTAQERALALAADSLAAAHRALRDDVARAALGRSRRELEEGREGLDYGLAAAAYGRSVALAAADSAQDAGEASRAPPPPPRGRSPRRG